MTTGQDERQHAPRWFFPARFMLFLAVLAVAVPALLPLVERWSQAVLGGFDIAALVYIASLAPLSRDHTPAQMRAHARANDARRVGVLVITGLLMAVIVTGVAVELPDARGESGHGHRLGLLLVLATLVVAWLFSNLIWALHYAHMHYRTHGACGLKFPGETPDHCPNFWDFAYFSLTIGMAFATSDVEITRSDIRRIATVHGTAAFFYNLVVLAFTINVTASG